VISGFIVDFYGHKASLVIEVDGYIHAGKTKQILDTEKENALRGLGLQIVRFRNEEVLRSLHRVIEKILELIAI